MRRNKIALFVVVLFVVALVERTLVAGITTSYGTSTRERKGEITKSRILA